MGHVAGNPPPPFRGVVTPRHAAEVAGTSRIQVSRQEAMEAKHFGDPGLHLGRATPRFSSIRGWGPWGAGIFME